MKYEIVQSKKFKRDLKIARKRGYDMSLLDDVVMMLANGEILPQQYCDHPLKGTRLGLRDCHIQSDWVLIYKIEKDLLVLLLSETGTHADLF